MKKDNIVYPYDKPYSPGDVPFVVTLTSDASINLWSNKLAYMDYLSGTPHYTLRPCAVKITNVNTPTSELRYVMYRYFCATRNIAIFYFPLNTPYKSIDVWEVLDANVYTAVHLAGYTP